jgi:hypothetical protein
MDTVHEHVLPGVSTTSGPTRWEDPATVENISLRCRRHNQYEAELVFGPAGTVGSTTA